MTYVPILINLTPKVQVYFRDIPLVIREVHHIRPALLAFPELGD